VLDTAKKSFDPAALKREFPGLAAPGLHYLDNAATAQMPEAVLSALSRFEIDARANVHEGLHARACAATDAYARARASVARFLRARSRDEVVFTYGATSAINLLAWSFGSLSRGGGWSSRPRGRSRSRRGTAGRIARWLACNQDHMSGIDPSVAPQIPSSSEDGSSLFERRLTDCGRRKEC
jgi:Aminotransferase class-V